MGFVVYSVDRDENIIGERRFSTRSWGRSFWLEGEVIVSSGAILGFLKGIFRSIRCFGSRVI